MRHIACSSAAVLLQLTVTSNCRLLQLAPAGWRLDIISSNSRCSYEPCRCRWEGRFAIFSGAQPLFGYYKVINRPGVGDIATAGGCPQPCYCHWAGGWARPLLANKLKIKTKLHFNRTAQLTKEHAGRAGGGGLGTLVLLHFNSPLIKQQ